MRSGRSWGSDELQQYVWQKTEHQLRRGAWRAHHTWSPKVANMSRGREVSPGSLKGRDFSWEGRGLKGGAIKFSQK